VLQLLLLQKVQYDKQRYLNHLESGLLVHELFLLLSLLFLLFLIKPFLTIKLDPAPASHARHIFLTSDACIELIFPPSKKIDLGLLHPKPIIT